MSSLPVTAIVKLHWSTRWFGVIVSTRDHREQYGPPGARSRSWTLITWWRFQGGDAA